MPKDTDVLESTAAMLTPRGRGAVASIHWRGDGRVLEQTNRPLFRAANGRPLAEQPPGRIVFGWWGDTPAEEVVVRRRDAQTIEVHCHGGEAAVRRILSDLGSVGCRTVHWTEQTATAQGVLESECLEALARATTLRTADILLDQYSGTLRATLAALHATPPLSKDGQGAGVRTHRGGGSTLVISSAATSLPCAPPCPPLLTGGDPGGIDKLLEWADFGLHLTRPWRVVLTGRPNVGKSSLINALLGYARSIVFDQPGTTRDVVTAEAAFDGWPVQLADTAGLRVAEGAIEAAGIARARTHFAEADCLVIVLDSGRPSDAEDEELLAEWPEAIVAANKSDLPDAWGDSMSKSALRVSSLTGAGIEALEGAIAARLVPRAPAPGTAIPVSERQVRLLRLARAAVVSRDANAVEWCIDELLR